MGIPTEDLDSIISRQERMHKLERAISVLEPLKSFLGYNISKRVTHYDEGEIAASDSITYLVEMNRLFRLYKEFLSFRIQGGADLDGKRFITPLYDRLEDVALSLDFNPEPINPQYLKYFADPHFLELKLAVNMYFAEVYNAINIYHTHNQDLRVKFLDAFIERSLELFDEESSSITDVFKYYVFKINTIKQVFEKCKHEVVKQTTEIQIKKRSGWPIDSGHFKLIDKKYPDHTSALLEKNIISMMHHQCIRAPTIFNTYEDSDGTWHNLMEESPGSTLQEVLTELKVLETRYTSPEATQLARALRQLFINKSIDDYVEYAGALDGMKLEETPYRRLLKNIEDLIGGKSTVESILEGISILIGSVKTPPELLFPFRDMKSRNMIIKLPDESLDSLFQKVEEKIYEPKFVFGHFINKKNYMQIDYDDIRKSHPIESLTMLTDSTGADQNYCGARFLAQHRRYFSDEPLLKPWEEDISIHKYASGISHGMADRVSQLSGAKKGESLFKFLMKRYNNHQVFDAQAADSEEFRKGYDYGFYGVPTDTFRTIKNRVATLVREDKLDLTPDYICS